MTGFTPSWSRGSAASGWLLQLTQRTLRLAEGLGSVAASMLPITCPGPGPTTRHQGVWDALEPPTWSKFGGLDGFFSSTQGT